VTWQRFRAWSSIVRVPQSTGSHHRAAGQARNRQQIVSTAQRLFAERSFADTSVVRIARETGVASTTVFNHFPHKEELFFHGRCPWAEIVEHLTAHPDRHTTASELIEVVAGIVAAHLARLAEPGARAGLVDLAGDPGLALWERGLQQRAEDAISVHIARHAAGLVAAEAQRCAPLTTAEASTIVADHRRAVLDPPAGDERATTGLPVRAVLVGRLTELRDLVVDQVTGPLASR
jgi:AcrR family transcriptional regulator